MATAPAKRTIEFTGPGGGIGDAGPSGETLQDKEIIRADGIIGKLFVDSGGSVTSDSKTLPQHLSGSAAYSNHTEVSNTTDCISGIKGFYNKGQIVRCYSRGTDQFYTDLDASDDCGIIFVSAPNVAGLSTAAGGPDRRVGFASTAVGVIYEFDRDGCKGYVQIYDDSCSLITNPYEGFNEVGILTGRTETPFSGKLKTNSDGTVLATVVSKRNDLGAISGKKVLVYQKGRGSGGSPSYTRMGDLDGGSDSAYASDLCMSGDGKIVFVNSPNETAGGCNSSNATGLIYAFQRDTTSYSLLGSVDPGEAATAAGTGFGTKLVTNMDGSVLAASNTLGTYVFNRTQEYYTNYYTVGCEFQRERDKHVPYIVTQFLAGVVPLDMSADGRAIVVAQNSGGGGVYFSNGSGNEYATYVEAPALGNVNDFASCSADGTIVVFSNSSASKAYKFEIDDAYLVHEPTASGKIKMSSDGKHFIDRNGDLYLQEREGYVYADEDGLIGINTSQPTELLDVNGNTIIRGDLTVEGVFTSPEGGFSGTFNGNASSATTASGLTGTPDITVNDITADQLNIRRIDTTGSVFVGNDLSVTGTKSFDIPHPSKEGWRLKYVCLEGPTADVYVRGKLEDSNVIELPDYWVDLVDQETIMVNLTPYGVYQELFVEKIEWGKKIIVKNNSGGPIKCSYVVYAERKDVDRNQTEYQP